MAGSARPVIAIVVGVGVVVGSLATAGCKAAPGQRVLKTEPIAEGPGTLESERRRLEGTWELVKLETYDAAGSPQTLDATGRMTFDAFGNVRTTGTAKQGSAAATELLGYTGKVVIDPQKKEWRLVDVEKDPGSTSLPAAVGADKLRVYEFVDDMLKLSLRDATGRVTASVTWRRTS